LKETQEMYFIKMKARTFLTTTVLMNPFTINTCQLPAHI
jgi:hypothetical protein